MSQIHGTGPGAQFVYTSSVKEDSWLPGKGPTGYEWWYFDALSDDERDALVVIFLDNFIFSPRYNSQNRRPDPIQETSAATFPAIAFFFYRDGKPLYRCINEYPASDFSAESDSPGCVIGNSSFSYESTPYGDRYLVSVSAPLRGRKSLSASIEWLAVESDLTPDQVSQKEGHFWNLVSPRSDVTGKVEISGGDGRRTEEINFRGTGYHDHNRDKRWLPAAVKDWTWGRIHFSHMTAVFYDYNGIGGEGDHSSLFIASEGTLEQKDVNIEVLGTARDLLGLKYPSRLRIREEGGIEMLINQSAVIDSSFFYTRFLCDATMNVPGSAPKRSGGIGEYLNPACLKNPFFDPLIDMRIGRNGRRAFLS